MRLRLPRAFLNYACQRTLVCCRAPMRAPLGEGETGRIRGLLERAGGGAVHLAEVLDGHLETHRGALMIAQPRGACPLLGDPPACRLQEAAGLAALPEGCHSFPRSVVERDDGVFEVAFSLRCPTAAGMLIASEAPFELVEVATPGWPYPPRAPDPEAGPPEPGIDALRAAWWRVLAEAGADGQAVIETLAALAESPSHPRPRPTGTCAAVEAGVANPRIGEVQRAIDTIPGRGPVYARFGWSIWGALHQPRTVARLGAMAGLAPRHAVAAASSWLQHARVHDPRPFAGGAGIAVQRTLAAVRLADCFRSLLPVSPAEAWRDALIACAHLDPRWQ